MASGAFFLFFIAFTSLGLLEIRFAVAIACFHQLVMRAACRYLAVFHHKDEVGILHRGDTLSDDDLCGFGNELAKSRAYKSICLCIDGACRIIEDQYLRLFEKRTRDAETLLLTARDICAALLDFVLYPSGKLRTKSSA